MQNIPHEKVEGENFRCWLESENYHYSHLANEIGTGGVVGIRIGKAKKSQWTKRGVPDYMIILKRGSLLFIELKRRRRRLKSGKLGASPSKISDEQKAWISWLSAVENVEAKIAYGSDDAKKIVQEMEDF